RNPPWGETAGGRKNFFSKACPMGAEEGKAAALLDEDLEDLVGDRVAPTRQLEPAPLPHDESGRLEVAQGAAPIFQGILDPVGAAQGVEVHSFHQAQTCEQSVRQPVPGLPRLPL